MNSLCIRECVGDVYDPNRATYSKVNRRPVPDVGRPVINTQGQRPQQPGVVDSISCRQLYLNSYKFTKQQSAHIWTPSCFSLAKKDNRPKNKHPQKKRCGAALIGFFRRLLCF